jgi:hypothetical protein
MFRFGTTSKVLRGALKLEAFKKPMVYYASSSTQSPPTINSSNLHSLEVINPDSRMPTTISPLFNPNIAGMVPPEPNRPENESPTDRGCFADPKKRRSFPLPNPMT